MPQNRAGNPNLYKGCKSLNPKGVPPKVQCVTPQLRDLMLGIPAEVKKLWEQSKEGMTGARVIAWSLYIHAAEGCVKAQREVMDRVDGRVPLPIQGPDGGALPVTFSVQVVSPEAKEMLQDVLAGRV